MWVDLSTFDVDEAKRFYSAVFRWSYSHVDGYHYARRRFRVLAGVFEMPQYLQEIDMPSFWMTYFTVPDVGEAVRRARLHDGAIVEMEPFAFGEGRIALVRDPAGAGFTLYEGPDIDARGDGSTVGEFVWNDLITSDVDSVRPFYRDVLGLEAVTAPSEPGMRFSLINESQEHVASLEVVPDDERGDKVFWLPYFAVDDIDAFGALVAEQGGHEAHRSLASSTALFVDSQGAAFGVVSRTAV